jgi:hypothetical protein
MMLDESQRRPMDWLPRTSPNAGPALALWVLHTYAFPLRDVSTYVGLEPSHSAGVGDLLS